MKVLQINRAFAKFGEFQIRHRAGFLVGLVLVTVLCFAGLPRLKLESSESEWFEDSERVKINQDHFEDVFGNDDSVMILVRSKNVFDPEVLDAIDRLGRRLEAEVPYADKVTSLMSLKLTQGTEEGFEIINPFDNGIPQDENEIERKRNFILSKESLRNNLVNVDGTETWVVLKLEKYDVTVSEAELMVGKAAQNVVTSDEFKSDKYEFLPTGMSYTEYEEDTVVAHECVTKIGAGFIVMILCLLLFTRTIYGIIVPAIATVFGITSVFGVMAWLNITGDTTMIALPVILGMALAVGYSIHFINSFKMHFRQNGMRKEAAVKSVEETGWPILFTVITTVASFVSFMMAEIVPVKWVGGCSTAIVFSVFVYVIILIPIMLSFGKNKTPEQVEHSKYARDGSSKADNAFSDFGKAALNKSLIVVVASAVIIIGMIPGIMRLGVNMDYQEMMGKRIPYVKRLIEILNSELGSQYSYDVMIEFEESDALKNPENFMKVQETQDYLGTLSLTRISGGKPRVTSVTGIVKEMNRTVNGDDENYYCIPDDQEMLTQLLFLYEISGGDELLEWINEDYSATHLHVELSGYDANKIVDNIDRAEAFLKKTFPDAKCSVIGQAVNYAEMNRKLVVAELKSFGGSFLIILILLVIAFSSVRTGLIAMIPNLAPVVMIGGIMGYLGFNLDMMTMTVMPMILGIAVDDTIHFTNHIKFYFEKTGDYKQSVINSFRDIGKTMGMTTFILCAMFFVFTFSPMNCLARIGLLSIIGLGSALVADYTLTPVLIYLVKPFGGLYEK